MKKQNVRTLSFIVSTFTYLLIGAAIFDALESQTEETTRLDLETTEKDYKSKYNISNDEYKSLEDIVIKYHPYRTFPQWKFTGAFYFSLTVITTIGYGHSTPQTIPGKTFCMFYAIIGIPLCLVMFQSVGERLNYFASFCIQLVKKCVKIKNTEVNQTEMVCVAGGLSFFVITAGAAMFSHYEGWSYFNSIYYCVITLTTIGFGDYVDRNNLSNTTYVILSFTFILFGLTVVASSINLLVLKFLTMNTDDERREEFSRKAQQSQTLRFSSTDLLNVVNGNVICTYEPSDLEELRRENSIKVSCLPSLLGSILMRRLPFFAWKHDKKQSSENFRVENFEYDLGRLDKSESNYKKIISRSGSFSFDSTNSRLIAKNVTCSSCTSNANGKKTHYTVRRGPGKISHLLINRFNSLDINKPEKQIISDSPKIFFKGRKDSALSLKQAYDITNNNLNKHNWTNSTTNGLSPNQELNLNFEINVFIDDDNDNDQEDCLTVTNATTLTTLTNTKHNNSDGKLKLLNVHNNPQIQSTPIEPNSDINFNFLSANYLSVNSIKKFSNNDLSSQNLTDYDLSDDKRKLDDESSLNDADEMASSKKFYV